MFLVTTADERYWKSNEKILFLGEWCKRYDRKHIWSNIDHHVLPYHWDDLDKLNRDCVYLQFVQEKYLDNLAVQLNNLHGEKLSTRYWRILFGPWLSYFIPAFYDAYLSIKSAAESNLAVDTWVPEAEVGMNLPQDANDLLAWLLDCESYHQFLYGWVIRELGCFPCRIKSNSIIAPSFPTSGGYSALGSIVNSLKNISGQFARFIPRRWSEVVVKISYMDFLEVCKLLISLKQFPVPSFPGSFEIKLSYDDGLRNEINLFPGDNEFESLLSKIIPEQMPMIYLEGYAQMKTKSLKSFPECPKVILVDIEICLDRGFKFWAAYQAEKGAKLVGIQHGGGYGCAKWLWPESHEKKIYDQFFSWGWGENDNQVVLPCASPRLTSLSKKIKPNPKGGIICVGFSLSPRYLYYLYSAPLSSQVLGYIKDQQDFVRSVSPEIHDILSYRLYPVDSGWNMESRWADFDPALKIHRGHQPLVRELNESRLCVHTYFGTSYLETMAANYPTLIFLNQKYWKIRESAQPYFDSLRQSGILHYTPESASVKVNEVCEDVDGWWASSEVQQARELFCHSFARTSDNWLSEWKKKIETIIQG